MNWNCTQTEERLSDFLDNLLTPAEVAELNHHAAECANCTQLVALVGGTVQRMRSLAPMEIPVRLVSAILEQTLGPRATKHGWKSWFSWTPAFALPKLAMGALTCVATLVIFSYAIGLNPARVRKGDLNPLNIYRAANRQTHLVYARGVKYVNDLRVVYEIQSRLRPEESPAREPEPERQPPSATPQEKSQKDGHPGRSMNRDSRLFAYVATETGARSQP
ncbi:MAG: zf-HC2 domain-containing protein [Candidatus Acidiferrales bacterium]